LTVGELLGGLHGTLCLGGGVGAEVGAADMPNGFDIGTGEQEG
jgi:hypothetical protein